MITFYIVLDYKDCKGRTSNVAFLRQQDAQDCVDEGCGSAVITVESEEIEWMKQAADAACEFNEQSAMGTLEVSTLYHAVKNYEQEIFYR